MTSPSVVKRVYPSIGLKRLQTIIRNELQFPNVEDANRVFIGIDFDRPFLSLKGSRPSGPPTPPSTPTGALGFLV